MNAEPDRPLQRGFQAVADALDQLGNQHEARFLAKLVLILMSEIQSTEVIESAVRRALAASPAGPSG